LTFEWAQIRLDSIPAGAEVKDLASGKVIGRTPFPFKVRPSRIGRQFALHRKDYVDAVVELVPDRPTIEYTEKLERGTGRPAIVHSVPDPGVKPSPISSSATTKPEPGAKPDTGPAGTATRPEPAGTGSAAVKPATPAAPPDDDCGDPPCLKADPSRPRGGSGSAS